MRNSNLKYKIGVFILLLTFELSAQTNEMVMNDNRIDQDYVATTELQANINSQNLIENKINLFLELKRDAEALIVLHNSKFQFHFFVLKAK